MILFSHFTLCIAATTLKSISTPLQMQFKLAQPSSAVIFLCYVLVMRFTADLETLKELHVVRFHNRERGSTFPRRLAPSISCLSSTSSGSVRNMEHKHHRSEMVLNGSMKRQGWTLLGARGNKPCSELGNTN